MIQGADVELDPVMRCFEEEDSKGQMKETA